MTGSMLEVIAKSFPLKELSCGGYVEGLLKNGGPSTDVFKKGIGEEKTAELFRKILFATEE